MTFNTGTQQGGVALSTPSPPVGAARVTQGFAEVAIATVSIPSTVLVDTESWFSYGPVVSSAVSFTNGPNTRAWSVPMGSAPTWVAGPFPGTFAVRVPSGTTLRKSPAGYAGTRQLPVAPNMVGFRFRTTSTTPTFVVTGQTGSTLVTLSISGGGVLLANGNSTGSVVNDGNWHYVEFYWDTVGTWRVVSVDNGAGGWIQHVGSADLTIGLDVAGGDVDVCDFYWAHSGSGGAGGDLLGPTRIECLMPSADGTHGDFVPTPAAAHHYLNVNDRPEDDVATLVISDTVGAIDTYTTPGLVSTSGFVAGVNVIWQADYLTNPHELAPYIISGGTAATGTAPATTLFSGSPSAMTLTSGTSGPVENCWTTDPNTGTAWTIAGVNAAEIGAKVTA